MVVLAKRFIRESFADPELSLAGVAARAGVSKNHLSWEFARETGETLTEYIARVRIDEAKRLFSTAGLKVYEVSERVGYQNVEHFSRVFKKVAGMSPSAWTGDDSRPESAVNRKIGHSSGISVIHSLGGGVGYCRHPNKRRIRMKRTVVVLLALCITAGALGAEYHPEDGR